MWVGYCLLEQCQLISADQLNATALPISNSFTAKREEWNLVAPPPSIIKCRWARPRVGRVQRSTAAVRHEWQDCVMPRSHLFVAQLSRLWLARSFYSLLPDLWRKLYGWSTQDWAFIQSLLILVTLTSYGFLHTQLTHTAKRSCTMNLWHNMSMKKGLWQYSHLAK